MALNLPQFKTDLKTAFSTSSDPTLKALTDAHWDQFATLIHNYIETGEVNDVTVDGSGNQNNVSNVQ
jgi:hypothetical protein